MRTSESLGSRLTHLSRNSHKSCLSGLWWCSHEHFYQHKIVFIVAPGTCEVRGPDGRVEVVVITPDHPEGLHDRSLWEQPLDPYIITTWKHDFIVCRKEIISPYIWMGQTFQKMYQREHSYPDSWPQVLWKSNRRAGRARQVSLCGEPWYQRKFLVLLEVLLGALMHRSQIQWKKNNEKCWLGAQRKEWNICARQ